MSHRTLRALLALCIVLVVAMTALTGGQLAPRVVSAAVPDAPVSTAWVTNGAVNAIVATGSTVYIAGDFTHVGPPTGNGGALSTTTGSPDLAWPAVSGRIYAVVPDGTGGWYIGGDFTSVGGQTRNRLARLKADKTLDATWNPNASSSVYTLAVSGTTATPVV